MATRADGAFSGALTRPRAYGQAAGRLWAGDPLALARHERIQVCEVTAEQMRRIAGGDTPRGLLRRNMRTMFVRRDQSMRERLLTMAHELAHVLDRRWQEADCEAFAVAFVDAGAL
jgi:hypothetical protein